MKTLWICCGRNGPMCIPVYGIMEDLEGTYKHIKFADMEFDNPELQVIRNAPECRGFMDYLLPSITKTEIGESDHEYSEWQQITTILDAEIWQTVNFDPISMLDNNHYNTIIIGAGPAGLTAAYTCPG